MPSPGSGEVGKSTTEWLVPTGPDSSPEQEGKPAEAWWAGGSRKKGEGEWCVEQTGVQLTAKDSKAVGPLRSSWLPPPPPPPRRPINSRWKDHITGRGYLSPSFHTSSDLFQLRCPAAAWPVCRLLLGKGGRLATPPSGAGARGHQGTHSGVGGRGSTHNVSKRERPSWLPFPCPLGPGTQAGLLAQGRPSHSNPP